MVERAYHIRTSIDTSQVPDDYTLEILASELKLTEPQTIKEAAIEFDNIRNKLQNAFNVLDEQLANLEQEWTQGDDAKEVKKQLRRLKSTTSEVIAAIRIEAPPYAPTASRGIAPALTGYAAVLEYARNEGLPNADEIDVVDHQEAALSGILVGGAAAGAAIGAAAGLGVGSIPGALIGTLIAGGAALGGSLFSSLGWGWNWWGESEEEANRRLAKEHLLAITVGTASANDNFPAVLETDIPQFDTPPPNFNPTIPDRNGIPDENLPTDLNNSYPPTLLGGPNGPGTDRFGPDGTDPNMPGTDSSNLDGATPNTPGTGTYTPPLPGNGGIGNDGLDDGGFGTDDLPATTTPTIGDTRLPGANDLDTSLARFTPNNPYGPTNGLGINNGPNGTVIGNGPYGVGPYGIGGPGGGSGGGTGFGPGGVVPGAAAGARGLGAGANGMMPFMPPMAGGRGDRNEEERERTTWLLEDDEIFTSDEPVTEHRIGHTSPKGRRG